MQDFDLGGKYDIRGVLGRGAMGTVYDAWDPRIDRRVAIKTVRRSGGDDAGTAEALARFREEARAAGRLANPHIVGVYDYGETDAFAYIVMEFVEGRTLKARLDEAGRLQPAEAGRIMQQVLQGLAYSHARGVIHRDIKPANIILAAGGEAKIADFGVAKLENSEMTAAGTIIGTPAYMAPEQFLGVGVDSRSDIYSAGVTLFHMLTGERPYDGTMSAIMHRVLKTEEAPPRAAERQAGISPLLDAVIAKAMAKQQADRFEGAEAFSLALRIALEAPASADDDRTVVRPPPSAQAAAGGRKGLSLPVMFAVAGLCGAGLAGWFVWGRAPQAAPSRVAVEAPAAARPPAPPPPVPVRSSEDVQRNVAAALAGQPCVSATVGPASNGGAAVHVIAGKDFADHAHGLAVAAAAGAPLGWTAETVEGPYCRVLNLLARSITDGRTKVELAGGASVLRDGDDILPQVTAPDFPAHLRVDYFSNDGTVAHFYPRLPGGAASPPGMVLHISRSDTAQAGPPYGTDMILALGTSLELPLRHKLVEPASIYVPALQAAIETARKQGSQIAGGIMVVKTTAK